MHVFIRTASTSSLIFSHFHILLKLLYRTAAKFKDLAKFVSFAEIFFYYFSSNTLQLFALENLPCGAGFHVVVF